MHDRQSFAHSVPVGTWTFTVQQLDVRGRPITPTDAQGYPLPDPTATATIATDTETPLDPDPIVLTPRPACDDGVDNDVDGRPTVESISTIPTAPAPQARPPNDVRRGGLLSSV